jgi:hypothetical protein
MEGKIFPVKKVTCRKDFVEVLNMGGVAELLKGLLGGKIRFGNQYFQVEGPDLIRHYLSEFGLWSYEDQIGAGITPERNKELVEFTRHRRK